MLLFHVGMVKGRKVTHPLASRIKRMMQTDDEVGKIAQPTPVLIGAALGQPHPAHKAEQTQ